MKKYISVIFLSIIISTLYAQNNIIVYQTQNPSKNIEKTKSKLSENATREYFSPFAAYFQWGKDYIGGNYSPFACDFHFSPVSFLAYGLDLRIGGIYDKINEFPIFFISWSPKLGFVFPFNSKFKIFGDTLLEIGYFGGMKGIITSWITPGFEVGIYFHYLEIRYRGNWYKNGYSNSIGISLVAHY